MRKRIYMSLFINIIIFLLVVIASIIMFTGFRFMFGHEVALESTKLGMFRFFTVDSNIFMGIIAFVFSINEILFLKGKIKKIKLKYYILKLMATSAVALTFFVVFAYLGPITEYGVGSLLMNSNLFFHLLIPVLSMINFLVFERTTIIKFKYSFFGVLPTALYALYYLINILIHTKNGVVSPVYDWYWFVQFGGVRTALIVAPIIFIISYLISLVLWRVNRIKG